MVIELPLPEHILGMCIRKEGKIIVNSPRPNLVEDPKEFRRLANLAEDCARVARVYYGENLRLEMERIGQRNGGSPKNPSYVDWGVYPTYFAGVIGGLEILHSQMPSGERFVDIKDTGEEVLKYRGFDVEYDFRTDRHVPTSETAKIVHYSPGNWEKRLEDWINTANRVQNSELVLAPFWS